MPLFSNAFGLFSLYYLVVYGFVRFISETECAALLYLASVLLGLPVVWLVFDIDGLLNFLLQGIHLDMR